MNARAQSTLALAGLDVSEPAANAFADALVGPALPDSPTAIAFGVADKPKRTRRTKAAAAVAVVPEAPAPAPEPAAAFPKMLADRSWGASVEGVAKKGDRIRITSRAGKSWLATVTAVHMSAEGRTIVSAQGDDPPEARTRGRSLRQQVRDHGRGRRRHASIGGGDFFVNARGRCEDAPCCGCCT